MPYEMYCVLCAGVNRPGSGRGLLCARMAHQILNPDKSRAPTTPYYDAALVRFLGTEDWDNWERMTDRLTPDALTAALVCFRSLLIGEHTVASLEAYIQRTQKPAFVDGSFFVRSVWA